MQKEVPATLDVASAKLWDEVGADWVAAGYQALWRRHTDRVTARLIARWLPADERRVLKTDLFDEAVSDGLVPALMHRAKRVDGIDIAAATVQAAGARHPALAAKVADVRALPYADGAFSAVVSLSTLDHFDRADEIAPAIAGFRRVTAPGGRLILTLDNPLNPKIALRQQLPAAWLERTGLVPYPVGATLSRGPLRAAVEAAGYRVLEETAIHHAPRVAAVRAAGLAQRLRSSRAERALLAALSAFEGLERAPTRWRTGHFTAILAEARD